MSEPVTPAELREAAKGVRDHSPDSPLSDWMEAEADRLEASIDRWAALASRPLGRKGESVTIRIAKEDQ